jgi:hypothetical protein
MGGPGNGVQTKRQLAQRQRRVKEREKAVSKERLVHGLTVNTNDPILKSVGYCRNKDSNTYFAYTILTQGGRVLSVDQSAPDLRTIIEDECKVRFVHEFMGAE